MSKNTNSTVKLQNRQLFSIKRKETLDARFNQHYDENANALHIIQSAVIVLVRNFFSEHDFSNVAKNLVRSLFLTSDADLTSVRHLCIYFQPYFSQQEWQIVISRLFKNQQEFLQVTKQARAHIDTLGPVLHSKEQTTDKKRILKAVFEDETGKLHNWSLGNVVRPLTTQDRKAVLDILGEVTILQKDDGTRKFVRVVKMYFAVDEREHDFNTRDEEDPMFEPRDADQQPVQQATAENTAPEKTIAPPKKSNNATNTSNNTVGSTLDKDLSLNDAVPAFKSQSELARERLGKLPSDHAKKYQEPHSLFNKPKPEKNTNLEKALKKKGKSKNRKRNRRK
ncbi:hypothetical protein [Candidatus Enterococcus ferrettii]|uniref:DUF4194 domain-containing protein n=1 Tax=Candidatus Enterococcus ferrettii TaxID=2815324 RepID=A0ABV0EUL0_9ENTE|nr:hypothetical protein [Enterococcus sp. 665A]MBO1341967.1 hypothetical protein [Enterococcus sp. 665A]